MTSLSANEIASMRADLNGTQLSMTCVIERETPTGTDPDGHPIGTWSTLYSGQCWYWEELRRQLIEEHEGPEVNVADSYPHLLLPANTDVTTWDRVASVVGVDGSTVAVNLNIRTVLHRLLDVMLIVESQK